MAVSTTEVPDGATADICDHPVGANRCRLRPHKFGRHDVAPDHLLDAYRPWPMTVRAIGEAVAPAFDAIRESLAATPVCPATGRVCSCRRGERCNPDVHRPGD